MRHLLPPLPFRPFRAWPRPLRNALRACLWACCACLLPSCFEIQETIDLRKDGSGTFQLLVDFSEHRDDIEAWVAAAKKQGQPVFGEGGEPFEELAAAWSEGAEALNRVNGISNAQSVANRKALLFGWRFDFADLSALNLVLALQDGAEYNPDYQPIYTRSKKILTKHALLPVNRLLRYLEEIAPQDAADPLLESQKKAIFARARYRCVIRLEGKIRKSSNSNFDISADKRSASCLVGLPDLRAGLVSIGTNLKFK
jgi:hypothetical protein